MDAEGAIKHLRGVITQTIPAGDGLDEYERYIVQIEQNIDTEPNICLEACKALAEGIFRHILKHERLDGQFKEILNSSSAETVALYKSTYKALDFVDVIDIELAKCGHIFFKTIGEVRNSIGMISHGRDLSSLPDLTKSSTRHVVFMTISYLLPLLDAYGQMLEASELRYEDNEAFNDYLNSNYELPGVTYSLALFDQDKVSYEEQLDEYKGRDEDE